MIQELWKIPPKPRVSVGTILPVDTPDYLTCGYLCKATKRSLVIGVGGRLLDPCAVSEPRLEPRGDRQRAREREGAHDQLVLGRRRARGHEAFSLPTPPPPPRGHEESHVPVRNGCTCPPAPYKSDADLLSAAAAAALGDTARMESAEARTQQGVCVCAQHRRAEGTG